MGAGVDASGGRTAELLKGCDRPWSSAKFVLPPGRGVARRRGECWSVAASGGGREAYSAGNFIARRWGTTCQAVLLMVVVVEERGVRTMLQIEGGRVRWSRHVYGWGTAEPC